MTEGGLYHALKGRCNIAVVAREGFFFIDCETRATLDWCIAELLKRGIGHLRSLFGRQVGRGGHIYLRCADGEVDNIPLARRDKGQNTGRMANIEIRGYDVCVGKVVVHSKTGWIYRPKADNAN